MAKLFKETVDREISRDNYHYPILPKNHMSKHIVLPSLAPLSLPEYPRMTSDNDQHPYTIWENTNRSSFSMENKFILWKKFINSLFKDYTVIVCTWESWK